MMLTDMFAKMVSSFVIVSTVNDTRTAYTHIELA